MPLGWDLLLRHDVGMSSDLLPASTLFHPYSGKAEMFGFSGVRHPAAPHCRLAARHDYGIAIDPDIFDVPNK